MSVGKVLWQPYVMLLWVLPGSVVVAGLATVYIAFHFADSEVDGNYYREGLAINEEKHASQMAAELHLSAKIERTGNWISVNLQGELSDDEHLQLKFSHPTDGLRDHVVSLDRASAGLYRGFDEKLGSQEWYISLAPTNSAWRLQTRASLQHIIVIDTSSLSVINAGAAAHAIAQARTISADTKKR